jgi:hypothetical protein
MALVEAVRCPRLAVGCRVLRNPARLSRRPVAHGAGPGDVIFPEDRYLEPLRPLRQSGDIDRYLDIDGAQEMFKQFTEAFERPEDWLASGHLIIVTGDSGYGKSSLIQRCAWWLHDHQQEACEVVVLDWSDEDWPPESDERIKRVLGRIQTRLSSYLDDEAMTKLASHMSDFVDAFHYLGDALRMRRDAAGTLLPPIALVILLAGYAMPAEVAKYYQLACRGTFVFAEVFDQDHIKEIEQKIPGFRRSGADMQHLVTSVLKSGDAERLLDWIRQEYSAGPDLPASLVQEWFVRLVDEREISVSQLSRLAWGVLHLAAKEAAGSVTNAHFTKYYEQAYYKDPHR